MPNFPRTAAATVTLTDQMIAGLPKDAIYADAPVAPAQLSAAEADYKAAEGDSNTLYAQYLAAEEVKRGKLSALQALMKRIIKFAENIPNVTQAQLKLIGWDTKADPTALQIPGQCAMFELVSVNGNLYDFDWMKPKDGGKPALYELVVRHPGENKWQLKANDTKRDLEEEIELEGGQWEVAVRAANDAGTGPVSNLVVLTVA